MKTVVTIGECSVSMMIESERTGRLWIGPNELSRATANDADTGRGESSAPDDAVSDPLVVVVVRAAEAETIVCKAR